MDEGRIMAERPIQASRARAAGYDVRTRTLEVEFADGSVYRYYGVPNHLHSRMMQVQSKGSFLNRYIRDSYPHSRVT